MDDLQLHDDVVYQTLVELDFINRWLGGNAITLRSLDKLWKLIPEHHAVSVADLGCGSGEMLRLIAQKARHQKRNVELTGIDANPHIVDYAQRHSVAFNIRFEALNIFSERFKAAHFDFTAATLFLHHFSDDELVHVFMALKKQTKVAIIVNDLHRHPLAYYSIKWLTYFFSASSMVKYDAPLSVLRAFKRTELRSILETAGIKNYELRWKWAFRWQLIINCQET